MSLTKAPFKCSCGKPAASVFWTCDTCDPQADIDRLCADLETLRQNRKTFQADFLAANSRLHEENVRLRALNAELVTVCEAFAENHRETKWSDPPKSPCECRLCRSARPIIAKAKAD